MVYTSHELKKIVSTTPVEYISEYQDLLDQFSRTASYTEYSNFQSKLDTLRGKLINDMTTLNEFENNNGNIYTKMKAEYSNVYKSIDYYVIVTVIGIIILFFLIQYVATSK